MGHNGCDGSQASGPWAIGSGYRFTPTCLEMERVLVCSSVRTVQPHVDPCMCLFVTFFSDPPSLLACLATFLGLSPR